MGKLLDKSYGQYVFSFVKASPTTLPLMRHISPTEIWDAPKPLMAMFWEILSQIDPKLTMFTTMILEFSVRNFRCFQDEATLSFTDPKFKTLTPRNGSSWTAVINPVTAIFGANGSGKSSILMALDRVRTALRVATPLYDPFGAGQDGKPTEYRIDFAAGNTRYQYFISAYAWGIEREELWAAETRWKKVFVRYQESEFDPIHIEIGNSVRGATMGIKNITTPHTLFLAKALESRQETLSAIANSLLSIKSIHPSDFERDSRMRWLIHKIAAEPNHWQGIADSLVSAADLGIDHVLVDEKRLPPGAIDSIRGFLKAIGDNFDVEPPEIQFNDVQRSLVFQHRTADGGYFELPLHYQSQGTLTWLGVAGPVVDALSNGHILLVDEIDASLHPALTSAILELFTDPSVNKFGAQLIFSTYDVSLLSNEPERHLEDRYVWLVEKDYSGCSEIYSLSDFKDLRARSNRMNKYLYGRFGGTPDPDLASLRSLINQLQESNQ